MGVNMVVRLGDREIGGDWWYEGVVMGRNKSMVGACRLHGCGVHADDEIGWCRRNCLSYVCCVRLPEPK